MEDLPKTPKSKRKRKLDFETETNNFLLRLLLLTNGKVSEVLTEKDLEKVN